MAEQNIEIKIITLVNKYQNQLSADLSKVNNDFYSITMDAVSEELLCLELEKFTDYSMSIRHLIIKLIYYQFIKLENEKLNDRLFYIDLIERIDAHFEKVRSFIELLEHHDINTAYEKLIFS